VHVRRFAVSCSGSYLSMHNASCIRVKISSLYPVYAYSCTAVHECRAEQDSVEVLYRQYMNSTNIQTKYTVEFSNFVNLVGTRDPELVQGRAVTKGSLSL
jgi:hypothetical protein